MSPVSSLPHYPRLPPGVIKPPTSTVALLTAGFGNFGGEKVKSSLAANTFTQQEEGHISDFPTPFSVLLMFVSEQQDANSTLQTCTMQVVSIGSPSICYDFLQSLSGHTALTSKPGKSLLCVRLSWHFNKVSEHLHLHLQGGKRCELKRHQKGHIYSGFTLKENKTNKIRTPQLFVYVLHLYLPKSLHFQQNL